METPWIHHGYASYASHILHVCSTYALIRHVHTNEETYVTGTPRTSNVTNVVHTSLVHSSYGQFGHWLIRPYGLFNPDPKNSALVNSVPDHLSVRTLLLVNSDRKKKISLVNSDLFHWSIRTFSIGQFGPFPLINSDLSQCSVRTLNRF